MPVLLVDVVFAVFLAAQAAVIFGGHDYVAAHHRAHLRRVRPPGLRPAHRRHRCSPCSSSGRPRARRPRDRAPTGAWLRVSLGLLCALTLVVVGSALHRMHLYQDAYGFTRLRLLVDVFEGWLGLLVLAVLAAGVCAARRPGCRGSRLVSGVVALLGLAAINPDAWIARQNLDRYATPARSTGTTSQSLSDDAVPVLAELPPAERDCALDLGDRHDDDWLEWNLGRARAATSSRPTRWVGSTGRSAPARPTAERAADRSRRPGTLTERAPLARAVVSREGGPMEQYVVGVDFGTLSGRAVVVRVADGAELGSATYDYPHGVIDRTLPTSQGNGTRLPPDWALQVADDYREVLRTAVPEAVRRAGVGVEDVVGIGIACTSCTMVPTTLDGTPLNELPGSRRSRTLTSSCGSTTPPRARRTGSTPWRGSEASRGWAGMAGRSRPRASSRRGCSCSRRPRTSTR